MKTTISLPFFCGFYESIFENCDTEYYAVHEDIDSEHPELQPDDYEFDYEQRRTDICNNFVDVFKTYAPSYIKDVSFSDLWSPRYYNYETDKLYANIELDDTFEEHVRKFIKDTYDTLKQRIYDDWSSRDGFISFMSNDIEDWYNELFVEQDTRYISEIVRYEMELNYGKDIRYDILYGTMEDIYDGSYLTIKQAA